MQKKTFDIQKLPTVPASFYAVGNQMLQTSTIQHMHSASGLPHVQPILISAVFQAGTSVFVFWEQESFCREISHQTSPHSSDIPHHTLMSELLYQCPIRYANDIILQLLKKKIKFKILSLLSFYLFRSKQNQSWQTWKPFLLYLRAKFVPC